MYKMIIERSEEEYMDEIKKIYNNDIKPLLDKGYSLTKAFNMNGITTGKKKRKGRELRRLALEDGYRFKR